MTHRTKQVREICRVLEEVGFKVVSVDTGRHLRITTEPFHVFTAAKTPGDVRANLNFRTDARKIWRKYHPAAP